MLVFIVASKSSVVDVEDRLRALLPAGIADEDVETAKSVHGFIDQLLAERLVAQIAGNRQRLSPCRLDQRDDFLRVGFFRREIVDRDIRAFARVSDGRGAAHAGIAAGDQRLTPANRPEPL